MADLMELEVWVGRVLEAAGFGRGIIGLNFTHVRTYFDKEVGADRHLVYGGGGRKGKKMKLYSFGFVFDNEGCLRKFEAADLGEYAEDSVLREGIEKLKEGEMAYEEWSEAVLAKIYFEKGVMKDWVGLLSRK